MSCNSQYAAYMPLTHLVETSWTKQSRINLVGAV